MQIATFPSVECRVLRIFEVHLQCRLFFQSQLLSGCWRILSTLGLVEVCRSVLGHQGRSARGQTLPKNPSKQSKQQGGKKKKAATQRNWVNPQFSQCTNMLKYWWPQGFLLGEWHPAWGARCWRGAELGRAGWTFTFPLAADSGAEWWKINTWEPGGKYFQPLTRECILTRPR